MKESPFVRMYSLTKICLQEFICRTIYVHQWCKLLCLVGTISIINLHAGLRLSETNALVCCKRHSLCIGNGSCETSGITVTQRTLLGDKVTWQTRTNFYDISTNLMARCPGLHSEIIQTWWFCSLRVVGPETVTGFHPECQTGPAC